MVGPGAQDKSEITVVKLAQLLWKKQRTHKIKGVRMTDICAAASRCHGQDCLVLQFTVTDPLVAYSVLSAGSKMHYSGLVYRTWMYVPHCTCCTKWMWSWSWPWWRAAMELRVDSDDGCIYVRVGPHMHHCRSLAINSTYCVIKMHSDSTVLVTSWLLQLIFPKGCRWHMLWHLL